MQDKKNAPAGRSPADIAREAFRHLGAKRIAPTPDAYREIYEEIAGSRTPTGAEQVLADFAAALSAAPGEVAALSASIGRALDSRDWHDYGKHLTELVERHLAPATANQPPPSLAVSRGTMPNLATVTAAPRSRNIPLVEEPAAPGPVGVAAEFPATLAVDTRQQQLLRDLLARTLTLALGALLRKAPALAAESQALAEAIRSAETVSALTEASVRLKQLCFKLEMQAEDMAEEHELLLRLFRLLLENVGELLDDDTWLSGQIASVQELLSGPITHAALEDATRSLKEVIYKQGALKHSLKEAKVTVRNMMITFIDRLGATVNSTGDFHQKIGTYQQKITKARGIIELNHVLDEMMQDTRAVQTEALRSRDQMLAARQEVQDAEARILELESKLEQMSELVREDQLTGSLNRRGLDDIFEREMARSTRRKSPLCIALLDLDDFKRLNDTYGHSAGDQALIHLVRVIKDTLRTMDVIARFGGEEFMIVLPDTPLGDAMQTVTRLQRELTKRIFLYENRKLLITFSAGVALRRDGEPQQAMIKRADEALYQAKRAGKNRVMAAE